MEVISQSLEPTMKAIQSATALLESLKELNKTDNFLVNNLLIPEVSRITSLQNKLVSLLETMQEFGTDEHTLAQEYDAYQKAEQWKISRLGLNGNHPFY